MSKEEEKPKEEAPKEKKEVKEAPKQEARKDPAETTERPRRDRREKSKRAVVHMFSSFNNTIMTATDATGAETITTASGGMVVRSGREKPGPFAAMQLAIKVADELKSKGFHEIDLHVRAPGETGAKSPGPGTQSAIRSFTRAGMRINNIEDVTPLPHGNMRKKGGKRGRRV